MSAGIELIVRYGRLGENCKAIALNVDEYLMRELLGAVELSNEPFSLAIASPGIFGGRGDAVTIRQHKFEMRRHTAERIAQAMIPALMEAFGVNDELDGYRIVEMTEEEKAWHRLQGRLPMGDE